MDGRPTWTGFDEAGDYAVPNVVSPRDLLYKSLVYHHFKCLLTIH